MYVAGDVRRACRMAGIFLGLKFGLWKVREPLTKVGGGGGNFELLQDMQFAFFLFSSRIGSPREIKFLCDSNWFRLLFTGTKFADWYTASVFLCFCASSFLLGRVGVLGLAGIDSASARDVNSKSGLAMAGSIGMGVLVGLVEYHWIWLCASL